MSDLNMRRFSLPSQRSIALAGCFVLCVLAMLCARADAQAVPAGTTSGASTNPADQPLAGQLMGTDLTLNQNANAIAAENESFQRFGLGLQASGGAITNFFDAEKNQKTAEYAQFSGDAGVLLRGRHTRYFAFYQPQYTIYPQYTEVNAFGQTVFQTLFHQMTEHTGVEWNTTAARYFSVNEYLPQTLGIGGIGIVVPTLGQQLLENSYEVTNAATNVHYRYLMSPRMTMDAALTGGYFLLVPKNLGQKGANSSERLATGGINFQLSYQWTPRGVVGFALTPVYIYGLFPKGHQIAETTQAFYERQVTATLKARIAAGPLLVQSSSPAFGRIDDTSYAVNASLNRQIRQSQFAAAYSRAFVVNLLTPAIASNAFDFSAYIPLRKNWIALGDGSYVHNGGTKTYGSATIYGGSAQIAYQATSKFQLFARYSLISELNHAAPPLSGSFNFSRNQFSGGIRFNLGNPIIPGGVQ